MKFQPLNERRKETMSKTTKARRSSSERSLVSAAAAAIPGDYLQNPMIFLIEKRNASAGVGPSVESVAKGIQEQIEGDFNKAWGAAYGNSASVTTSGSPRPQQDIVLYIVDQSSYGLGYHTYDPGQSYPFYGEITGSGDYWSITASHEVLEALADPYVSNCAPSGYLQEVGDPVEDLSYKTGSGIYVSDFAFPSWFGILGFAGPPFDQLEQVQNAGDPTYGYITTCATQRDGSTLLGIKIGPKPGSGLPPSLIRGRAHPLAARLIGRARMEEYRDPRAFGYKVPR